MLSRTRLGFAVLVACCLAAGPGSADVLTVGKRSYSGAFEGFRKRQFLFRTTEGRLLKQDRGAVRSLRLDEERPIRWQRLGRKEPEDGRLVGYDKARFTIKSGRRKEAVLGMHVQSMSLRWAARNGGEHEGRPRPERRIDLPALERRPNLTPTQVNVLRRYRSVRRQYDAFVAESSALVAEMDRATGRRREGLMDVLRRRKDKEQPLKRSLEKATAALLAAFPDPFPQAGETEESARPAPEKPAPTEGPRLAEDEILLIDVSGLKGFVLSREQSTAIGNYEAAMRRYRSADAEAQGQAIAELKEAQTALLRSFPDIKIVR